jgi:hypothetical protein
VSAAERERALCEAAAKLKVAATHVHDCRRQADAISDRLVQALACAAVELAEVVEVLLDDARRYGHILVPGFVPISREPEGQDRVPYDPEARKARAEKMWAEIGEAVQSNESFDSEIAKLNADAARKAGV